MKIMGLPGHGKSTIFKGKHSIVSPFLDWILAAKIYTVCRIFYILPK